MPKPTGVNDINRFLGSVTSVSSIRDGVNESYRVCTTSNTYFIKFGTSPTSDIMTEIFVMNKLNSSVKTPDIYLFGITEEGTKYYISEFIEETQGPYPTELNDDVKFIPFNIGRILGSIHNSYSSQSFGILYNNSKYASWSDFYTEWLRKTLEDSKKNYPHASSEGIRLAHWVDIPTPESFKISPLDLHSRNIFYNSKNEICGVIDLERCFGGHPAWSFLISRRFIKHSSVENSTENFTAGYRSVRSVPDLHPAYKIGSVARVMSAAHMIWENEKRFKSHFRCFMEELEQEIEQ